MRRLSGTDSLFLSGETPNWHQHVAGLVVLDPTGIEGFGFERVRAHVESRLPLVPKLQWKLRGVPLGLDHGVWVDDDEFDLRRHFHRLPVPPPGDARATAIAIENVLSRQLDRRFPLWEMWYLDGLANGRAAMLMKLHHCLLDGGAGSVLATLLFDLERDPPPRPEAAEEVPPEERAPNELQLVLGGLGALAAWPFRSVQYAGRMAQRTGDLVRHLVAGRSRPDIGTMLSAPKTSFNQPIGPRRSFAFSSVALQDVRAIATKHDVKVNDVALALCAGAIRRYLEARGELPMRELTAGVPVSLRAAGDTSMSNQLSYLVTPLGTHVEDPVERLVHVAEQTRAVKEVHRTLRAHPVGSIGDTAPPFVFTSMLRLAYETHVLAHIPGMMNTIVSNVPGPPVQLYMAGAELTGIFSASVLLDCMGLNITLFTFGDRVDFGLHVDPDLVPDPWAIADAIPAALAELLDASGLGPPHLVPDAFGLTVPMPGSDELPGAVPLAAPLAARSPA